MAKYVDESGVGVLWRKIQTRTESLAQETVYITLKSTNDQPIYTTITVSNNDETTTYEYNNSPISFKVPGGSDYNIKLGALEDYKWPLGYDADEGVTYTSIANCSRNLTFNYRFNGSYFSFSITPEEVRNVATVTASYMKNGELMTRSIKHGDILWVAKGTEVTVTAQKVTGYITPAVYKETMMYDPILKNISYVKPPSTGIYILGNSITDIHTVESWTGGSNATGVLLISDYNALVIAPDEWWKYASNYGNGRYDDYVWNGNTRSAWSARDMNVHGPVPGVPIYNESDYWGVSPQEFDIDGKNNTSKIIEYSRGYTYQSGDPSTGEVTYNFSGAPAAEFCNAYSNGCIGVGEWYLPAIGELNDIMENFYEVNEAMEKISGKPFRDDSDNYSSSMKWGYYWSSTIYLSKNTGRYGVYGYGHLEDTSYVVAAPSLATDNLNARPVAKLEW